VIQVLDVAEYATPGLMGGPDFLLVRDDIERQLRGHLHDVVAELPRDASAAAVFLMGDPAHELATESANLDLLVTGSRGYGPLRAVMLGGVTGRVVRDAACPVVIIPRSVEAPLARLFDRDTAAST
jgi:nucleotide-binding universal stress UspA family protein